MFVCLKAHVNDRMCVLSVCVCVCLSVCSRLEMLTKLPISCLFVFCLDLFACKLYPKFTLLRIPVNIIHVTYLDRQPRALGVDELGTNNEVYRHKESHLGCSDMRVCRAPSVVSGSGGHFSKWRPCFSRHHYI